MIETFKNLLGFGPKVNYAELVKKGAIVLDVRSKGEYAGGHVKGSLNIPLDSLGSTLNQLRDKHTPIITCCASGMRSAAARSLLQSKGYKEVYNGGGWTSLRDRLK